MDVAMQIDHRDAISLSQFAKEIGVSASVVHRWCDEGRINPHTQKRVFLRRIKHTFGWATSHAAYDEFIEALNEGE